MFIACISGCAVNKPMANQDNSVIMALIVTCPAMQCPNILSTLPVLSLSLSLSPHPVSALE